MHIGQLLEEKFLLPRNISPASLAKALHTSPARISGILQGTREITADTDLRLCAFFGLEEGYFLKLQIQTTLQKERMRLKAVLSKIEPLSTVPVAVKTLRVAVLCGGPSLERGISLNSARSVLDHLSSEEVEITPLYVDVYKNFYALSPSQLYSNTPSDFDFKLQSTAQKLTTEDLLQILHEVDIVFPVIHGAFGENGELQAFLESHKIPFVGSSSATCQRMFDKHDAASLLRRYGYPTLPTVVLRKGSPRLEKTIQEFFATHSLQRAVVKPIAGGSSIGVSSACSPQEALEKALKLFDSHLGDEALLEPFCTGREFTVIVLQNPDGTPVALIPTEIQVTYDNGGLFDYRRKYLPTTNTHWFCPPRFDDGVVDQIRGQAEELFTLFHMRDFARLDGWFLDDGTLLFSDFNPISGMEQNSFIFQQASRIGLTHGDLLRCILSHACGRETIKMPENPQTTTQAAQPVHILFGGDTAERQVSLMTGTNVWLKLRKSTKFPPVPFLLDQHMNVWKLPYTHALNHTVEEIYEHCCAADKTVGRIQRVLTDIQRRLVCAPQNYTPRDDLPTKLSFDEFVALSASKNAFVFLALHGGEGENGILQEKLERASLRFNGSGAQTSQLCMDKQATGQAIAAMAHPSIMTVPKRGVSLSALHALAEPALNTFWQTLQRELSSETFIIKPQRDGCSAGIVRLFAAQDLKKYVELAHQRVATIPPNAFKNQLQPIDMPHVYEDDYLMESFIETDYIRIQKNELIHQFRTGWIELTCGVLETNGVYHALNPSITVVEGEVLSVEEKFQGGTGVNITPPFETIIPKQSRETLKRQVETIAQTLRIENYARIDLFFNTRTERTYVIEANTLPALTPATVLYQQALCENPPMYPRQFLERLIESCLPPTHKNRITS
jgi:addiction module HigA family antidote